MKENDDDNEKGVFTTLCLIIIHTMHTHTHAHSKLFGALIHFFVCLSFDNNFTLCGFYEKISQIL